MFLICFWNADNWNWTNDLLFARQLLYRWAISANLKYLYFHIDLILYLKVFMSQIDPKLKKRLLKETQTPYKGLRRILWIAFSGSAFLGLFIMLSKIASGSELQQNNLLIQIHPTKVELSSCLYPVSILLVVHKILHQKQYNSFCQNKIWEE